MTTFRLAPDPAEVWAEPSTTAVPIHPTRGRLRPELAGWLVENQIRFSLAGRYEVGGMGTVIEIDIPDDTHAVAFRLRWPEAESLNRTRAELMSGGGVGALRALVTRFFRHVEAEAD
jgi:hypothetical protein